jgi:hypothetical protein
LWTPVAEKLELDITSQLRGRSAAASASAGRQLTTIAREAIEVNPGQLSVTAVGEPF